MASTSDTFLARFGAGALRVTDASSSGFSESHRDAAWDAIVWNEETAGCLDPTAIALARECLAPQGSLAIRHRVDRGRAIAPQIQNLVIALSGAGFVILDEDAATEGAAVWIVARTAPMLVRRYREGDEQQIGQLFERSFRVERSQAAWHWKFCEHPWGQRAIALAWDVGSFGDGRERLVGQYAAMPMRLAGAGSDDDRALQLCDIMTASEARGVGRGPTAVLSRMLRLLYAAHAEDRVGFVIGWNTATSRAFAKRFHRAHEQGPVAYWERGNAIPKAERGYRIRAVERFGQQFDRLFRRVLPAYGYLQRRDAEYLTWRYRQPGIAYLRLAAYRLGRLVGWAIFRRHDERLVWGDALIDPSHAEAAGALIAAALGHAEAGGAARLTAWFAEHPSWWQEQLLALGFKRMPEPNDLSLIYGVHSQADAGRRLARLYYTMGDSDLF